jgi:sarcosine oxidase subunit gamma
VTTRPTGRSPVHQAIEALGAHWGEVSGTPIALDFGSPEEEAKSALKLGLCDLSALPKLGLKGGGAVGWLGAQGVDVPAEIFEARPLQPEGIMVRAGNDECLVEGGLSGEPVVSLSERLGSAQENVYRVERQDATFILTGSSALRVMTQVCGVNFEEAPAWRVVYSRVAGVSAALLPTPGDDVPQYRIWVDPTSAPYLWGQLFQICLNLDGHVVGAQAVC